jgi:hypothetical protein
MDVSVHLLVRTAKLAAPLMREGATLYVDGGVNIMA